MRGFIALTSVLILSVILLAVVLAGSTRYFYAAFDALERQYKEQSIFLARTCLSYAALKLSEDSTYAGPDTYVFDSGTCSINSVNGKEIRTSGVSHNAITNMIGRIHLDDFSVTAHEY